MVAVRVSEAPAASVPMETVDIYDEEMGEHSDWEDVASCAAVASVDNNCTSYQAAQQWGLPKPDNEWESYNENWRQMGCQWGQQMAFHKQAWCLLGQVHMVHERSL